MLMCNEVATRLKAAFQQVLHLRRSSTHVISWGLPPLCQQS